MSSILSSRITTDYDAPSQSSYTKDTNSIVTYTTDLDDESSALSTEETELNYTNYAEYNRQVRESIHKQKSLQENNSPPFYRRKRFWAMCVAINIVLNAIFIPLIFLVIIPNAAQSSVNKSNIEFDAINITNPKNDSFIVTMSGRTDNTGPFGATITFNGPVDIIYNNGVIGTVLLDPINVSGGKGELKGTARNFTIGDKGLFNDFTSKVLTVKEFEWTLRGSASVKALGVNVNNIKLNKAIKIPGSNGFVTNLLDLKANENPDKTLSLQAVTNIFNPSPIGIELGDLTIQLKNNQTLISVVTAKDVFIGAKESNITFTGTSTIPTTEQDRLNLISVVSGYLTNTPVNTTANIISIIPKNGPVDWLDLAVKNFTLVTQVGSQPNSQKIITNLDFGKVILKFTPDEPYSPTISSTNAVADYTLPFNINFKISSVGQKVTLATTDNKDIATIESPQVPVNSTDKQIILSIPETKMQILDAGKFSDLLTALTTNADSEVVVYGKSNIDSSTDILGQVPIQGLPFNLTTKLQGFQQFNSNGNPPIISDLTILAGTPNQLYLGVVATLTNPSQYSISVGKVKLDMFYKEKKLGTAEIQDFTVGPGPNPVTILAIMDDPGNSDVGKELFTSFLTGQESIVNIKGSDQSTNITSLIPAFKSINIPSTLPPLKTPLLLSSKIVIDDQTTTTNISTGVVQISNPFMAPISIFTMNSSFSFNGVTLGTLEQDRKNDPIFIPGNSIQTIQLPVKMVIDPSLSFSILRTLALQNNMDVTVLDSLIALTNVTVPGANLNASPTPQEINSFNLQTFVTTALAKIPVTVNLTSIVAIGDYITLMTYKQDVVATTDNTIFKLIPMLAGPLINNVLAQSQMTFNSLFIQNIDVLAFDIVGTGQITNTGPLPATINFPTGLSISANNILLGTVQLPPIIAQPGGISFNNVSRFTVADVTTFASFSQFAYESETVSYDISSDNVMITSFGLPIGPISMKKTIQIVGFNGLKQFQVQNLVFPFAVTIGLNNPSTVGIELGTVVYDLFVSDEKISTITGKSINIQPKTISSLTFSGDLNLTDGHLIQSFFSTNPPLVTAKGVSVNPPKATGPVEWLLATFKSLELTAPFSASSLVPATPAAPAAPAAPPHPIQS
uniref:Uncharacterized protein MJ0943 n=1 Tax=Anthurium amnicola TaxID=1678845 RepID=A0A1D1Y653_9ARAE